MKQTKMPQITYDPDAQVLNIKLKETKVSDSDMVDNCVLDYDDKGEIINIEITEISPSSIKDLRIEAK